MGYFLLPLGNELDSQLNCLSDCSSRAEVLLKHLLIITLLCFMACKKTPEENARLRLENSVKEMSAVLETYEKKIASAGNDPGLRSRLLNDQALLKSRIERLKEMIAHSEKH